MLLAKILIAPFACPNHSHNTSTTTREQAYCHAFLLALLLLLLLWRRLGGLLLGLLCCSVALPAGLANVHTVHASTKPKHEVEGGLLLDVVILEGAAILKLLASEDEALLIGWDPLLVLDLGLDRIDCVCALDLEGNGLAGECFDEDLRSTADLGSVSEGEPIRVQSRVQGSSGAEQVAEDVQTAARRGGG